MLPASAVTDGTHQANPVLGFTLDEQIRRNVPGVSQMSARGTAIGT